MAYECRIVADSISSHGHRLTTMIITLPRIVLAEFNTHCMFSRNSASSRAIPTRKQLQAIVKDTFRPVEFGTAVGGMNAGSPLSGKLLKDAQTTWDEAAMAAVWNAMCLTTSPSYIKKEWKKWRRSVNDKFDEFVLEIARRIEDKEDDIHQEALLWTTKGLTNRLLEPFMWHTVIVTATEWENFFNLRADKEAQLEIRTAAEMMKEAYNASTPVLLEEGEWHLPFIQPEEKEWAKQNPEIARKAVTARCARVSYLTHDKSIVDIAADIRLADSLASNGHMSPFEHAATPFSETEWQVREKMVDAVLNNTEGLEQYVIGELIEITKFSGKLKGWGAFRREQPNQRVFTRQAA